MNYYIDTEFIEGFHGYRTTSFWDWSLKSLRAMHTIDLISIGIVSEDGREYYAVSKDFDLKLAWNKYDLQLQEMGDEPKRIYWLRDNVLKPIWKDLSKNIIGFAKDHTSVHESFTYKNLKSLISWYGKTNKQIAAEIQCFTSGVDFTPGQSIDKVIIRAADRANTERPPIFYGYFADYDWVLFCSLFGRMIDLPKGYPMYCRDLKQVMDDLNLDKTWKNIHIPGDNEHHALADARWNRKLHEELIREKNWQMNPLSKKTNL